jgi:hypothetical protein
MTFHERVCFQISHGRGPAQPNACRSPCDLPGIHQLTHDGEVLFARLARRDQVLAHVP